MNRRGFILLEAILTVVIVSICLTFLVQSLLTNFRTGVRFQEMTRSLLAMENRLGFLYATKASEDMLGAYPQAMEEPFAKFTVSAQSENVNDHLKRVGFIINWPQGQAHGHLDVATIVYIPDVS